MDADLTAMFGSESGMNHFPRLFECVDKIDCLEAAMQFCLDYPQTYANPMARAVTLIGGVLGEDLNETLYDVMIGLTTRCYEMKVLHQEVVPCTTLMMDQKDVFDEYQKMCKSPFALPLTFYAKKMDEYTARLGALCLDCFTLIRHLQTGFREAKRRIDINGYNLTLACN